LLSRYVAEASGAANDLGNLPNIEQDRPSHQYPDPPESCLYVRLGESRTACVGVGRDKDDPLPTIIYSDRKKIVRDA
jgi:hypothetical protein